MSRLGQGGSQFSVVLRARREIVSGEEITIQYVPVSLGQPARGSLLSSGWHFLCHCPRCLDVTEFGTFVSAIKCSRCREGLILPGHSDRPGLWRCRSAHLVITLLTKQDPATIRDRHHQ